jgi:hypothetical protein
MLDMPGNLASKVRREISYTSAPFKRCSIVVSGTGGSDVPSSTMAHLDSIYELRENEMSGG